MTFFHTTPPPIAVENKINLPLGGVFTKQQRDIQNDINQILQLIDQYDRQNINCSNKITVENNIIYPLQLEVTRLSALLKKIQDDKTKVLKDIQDGKDKDANDKKNDEDARKQTYQNSQKGYDDLQLEVEAKKKIIDECEKNIITINDDIIESDKTKKTLDDMIFSLTTKFQALKTQIVNNERQITIDNGNMTILSGQINDLNDILKISIDTNAKNKSNIDDLNSRIFDLYKIILLLEEKIYSNVVYNNQNLLKLTKNIDSSLNNLFSYLKKQNISPNVIYEKIEHRDIEHEKLYNTNKIIDVLFYCFYFAFVLIMICIGNTKREYFLIYLFVGLIPFIYPFIFKFLLYIIKYLSIDLHGPKKSFVDINNTLYA